MCNAAELTLIKAASVSALLEGIKKRRWKPPSTRANVASRLRNRLRVSSILRFCASGSAQPWKTLRSAMQSSRSVCVWYQCVRQNDRDDGRHTSYELTRTVLRGSSAMRSGEL